MTNQERNLKLAKLVFSDVSKLYINENGELWVKTLLRVNDYELDYCTNWNDLMPLVFEHEVDITAPHGGKMWDATHWDEDSDVDKWVECSNTNPQIALVDCLIKVLEEKNNVVDGTA